MNRLTLGVLGFILILAAIAWRASNERRHPLLIDAAFGGEFCDVNNPPAAPPRVRSTIEPRRQVDQRTIV